MLTQGQEEYGAPPSYEQHRQQQDQQHGGLKQQLGAPPTYKQHRQQKSEQQQLPAAARGFASSGLAPPAITTQPKRADAAQGNRVPPPNFPEGIPKGLEILAMVDGMAVHQTNNRYNISNHAGAHMYHAVEESGAFWRCCFNWVRPSHVKVFDQTGSQVLAFQRHFRCCPCAWFPPCLENVTVFHGPKKNGKVIGRVTQPCCGGCCTPRLNVLNGNGDRELVVKGPSCIVGNCRGQRFDLLADEKVGELEKLAGTADDRFTISFTQHLKVETKATALMALLVLDLLFFEFGGNSNDYQTDLCVMFCCGCPLPCGMRSSCRKDSPQIQRIVR